MNISFREFRAALAVLQHRNFSRAAQSLGVSQPALSVTIAELETRLGIPLFHRTTRSVQPTEIGKTFLNDVARVLDDLDRVVRDLEDQNRSRRGRLIVTCLSSIAGRLMPKVIRACERRYPELEIVIRDDVATRILASVSEGEADFSVTGSLQIPNNLMSEQLALDRLHVAFGRSHRFAKRREVTWRQLNGETVIILATNSGVRALIDGALATTKVAVKRYIEVSQLATVHGMLEEGLGVSILPALALPNPRHPFLRSRPLVEPSLARPIRLLWRRDRNLSALDRAFIGVLREVVG
jgi:DNA-binding transcriptional LysR family regulator